jgi:hypothetical protein
MSADSLAAVAGPTGVGAVCILGIFLFLDGRAPELFPTVEVYAKTATWGIVAAVPLLVMSYVVGVMLVSFGELLVQVGFGPSMADELQDLARLAANSAEESAAVQSYLQLRHDRGVLAGSAIAFIVLCAGAISEIRNLGNLKGPILSLAASALVLAASTYLLAGRKGREAHRLASAIAPAMDTRSGTPTP